ncbi:unnamed protein product [Trichobilharzia regenti]|nr:unnamed protein product [Trichobilharzia regenti]
MEEYLQVTGLYNTHQDGVAVGSPVCRVYRRYNLNLPPWLPSRSDCLEYILDSPITQVGLFVSAETGRALADAGVQFTACYCSPAFRCVQTACELLRAMGRVSA